MEEHDPEEVRQGETRKGVRWMLIVGTAVAVIALVGVYLIVSP